MTVPVPAPVREFLEALADRDFDRWESLWIEDGVGEFPYHQPGAPARIEGRAALRAFEERALSEFGPFRFTVHEVHAPPGGERVVVEFTGVAEFLPTGRMYRQRYISVFALRDGRIAGYREYRNHDVYRRVSGPAPAAGDGYGSSSNESKAIGAASGASDPAPAPPASSASSVRPRTA